MTIHEIIIHCTATREGREVETAELRRWHKACGMADIGYHYLIHLDGRTSACRPLTKMGAHCLGHNAHSIGICYVGGLAADGRTPKDTRTPAQCTALKQLLATLRRQYPAATLHGHNEFAAKACPCFNVQTDEWCKV